MSHARCTALVIADHSKLRCMNVGEGGGTERSGIGSAVQGEHHRRTQNHAVSEGIWSASFYGPQVPHAQVPGDERRRIPLRSVFGLVLGHLCSFWPETSGFVITAMPYPRGECMCDHRWGSVGVEWSLGRPPFEGC